MTTMARKEERDPEQDAVVSVPPDLEKLGRQRPECFKSLGSELAFCFSIVMSQILAVSNL